MKRYEYVIIKIIIPVIIILIPVILLLIQYIFKLNLIGSFFVALWEDYIGSKSYEIIREFSWIIYVFFSVILYIKITNGNKDKVFNNLEKNGVDVPYFWFFIASKILKYRTVKLALLPVHIQFRLVINSTFENTESGVNLNSVEEEINVKYLNHSSSKEINLLLADTYSIEKVAIQQEKIEKCTTILIERPKNDNKIRLYSPNFMKECKTIISKYNLQAEVINIYPYTNSQHNLELARDCFKLANRGKLTTLNIYQPDKLTFKFTTEAFEIKLS